MRNIQYTFLLALISGISIQSCNVTDSSDTKQVTLEQPNNTPKKEQTFDEYKMEQLNSGVRKDTIIDNLVFGMSQNQVSQVLNKLKRNKKVKSFAPNEDNRIILAEYEIGVKNYITTGVMQLLFYKNEMFKCVLMFREKSMSVSLSTFAEDFQYEFEQSMGPHKFSQQSLGGTAYQWAKGNQSITIGQMLDPNDPYYFIEYEDNNRYEEAGRAVQEEVNQ